MIRVLIADSRAERREQWRAHLAADPEIEITGLARDGQEALQLAHELRPDVALLAADLAGGNGYETTEILAAARDLPTQAILLSPHDAPDGMRRAMRAGAREHLALPVTRDALLQALRAVHAEGLRRRSAAFAAAADPGQAPRVLCVTGAKGGIGKTTLAVNLAAALARETGAPTVLIDLYAQFGDAATLLNLSPRRTLADLAKLDPADVDAPLLEGHLEQHESGLRVLAGAHEPVALDAVGVPCIEHVLGLLKRQYRYLVLDMPPILHPTTLYALSHAATALLVANLFDITTLHDTRRLLETLEGKYVAPEKIRLVLNRVSRQNRLEIPDVERTLGRSVAALIPNDGKIVPASINNGAPFVLDRPGSPVAQSVRLLARSLAPAASAPPDRKRRLGLAGIRPRAAR